MRIVLTVIHREALISMAKPKLRLVSPTTVNRTVPPRRRPNAELRTREHLTPKEVDKLIAAASGDQVDLNTAVLHVRRVKAGTSATHPLTGMEMRALRRLRREGPPSPFCLSLTCRPVKWIDYDLLRRIVDQPFPPLGAFRRSNFDTKAS